MMKKIGYIIGVMLLLIGSINVEVKAQEKEVLDHIFIFKLGMSVEELLAQIDTTQIAKDISENVISHAFEGRERRIAIKEYIPQYDDGRVATSYTLEDIEADFLDNILYSFRVRDKNNNLEAIMTDKYGKPKNKGKLKTKTVKEYKPYAERTSELDEVTHTMEVNDNRHKEWQTGSKDILCKQFGSLYRITDKKTSDMKREVCNKYWKEKRKREKEEEKKQEQERKANPILDVL